MSSPRAPAPCATTIRWCGRSTRCAIRSIDCARLPSSMPRRQRPSIGLRPPSTGRKSWSSSSRATMPCCRIRFRFSDGSASRPVSSELGAGDQRRRRRHAASDARYVVGGSAARFGIGWTHWPDRHAASDNDSVAPLLAHGRLLHDLLPAVDDTLKAMRAVPRKPDQDALRSMILTRQIASRTTARQFRRLLYGDIAAAGRVPGLSRAAAAVARQGAAAPRRVRACDRGHLDALHQCAAAEYRCRDRTGARRHGARASARTVPISCGLAPRRGRMSGAEPGKSFPPGWPERAPALAARFDPVRDGIIHVPQRRADAARRRQGRVHRPRPGGMGVRDECRARTVPASCSASMRSAGRCRITTPGELSLLRMALDTIVYAVGRHAMEKERARLETRLQQARRMETVGTFTSGIAHNFNNILGGILGHSEVMEEHLGSGRPAASQSRCDPPRRGAGARSRRSDPCLRTPPRRAAQARERAGFDRRGGVAAECLAAAGNRTCRSRNRR